MLFYVGLLLLVHQIRCEILDKQQPIWNSTFTDKLKKDLLTNYDRFARPVHHRSVVNVNVSLSIHHIEINEKDLIMTLNGWLKFAWNDDKLKWNPANYDNLKTVHMAEHEVWKPDILLYNSALGNDILHYGKTQCIVYAEGGVLWVPPTQFRVFCDLDLRNWPNDVQTCRVKIGSWTYSAKMLNIKTEKTELLSVMENPEWSIIETTTTRHAKLYECCPHDPYIDIEYNITIQRRSEMQKIVAFVPITVVILTTLASFWLPSESGEKIFLNGINAVILIMSIKYFSTLFPISSTHVPLIVLQYCVTLFLVCVALILNVIVIKVSRHHQNKSRNIPGFCKCFINSWYGSFLGLHNTHAVQKVDQELNDGHVDDTKSSVVENQCYWSLLGALIDRTAFYVYLIVFVIMTFTQVF